MVTTLLTLERVYTISACVQVVPTNYMASEWQIIAHFRFRLCEKAAARDPRRAPQDGDHVAAASGLRTGREWQREEERGRESWTWCFYFHRDRGTESAHCSRSFCLADFQHHEQSVSSKLEPGA